MTSPSYTGGSSGSASGTSCSGSVGEEADGEEGESEEDDASAVAVGTVLGSKAELREPNSLEDGPTRGSGGRGRSSGNPGRIWEVVGGAYTGGGAASVPR